MNVPGGTAFLARPLQRAAPDTLPMKQPAEVIASVFSLLDRNRIGYCLVHGHDGLPHAHGSDIDCIIDAAVTPEGLLGLLTAHRQEIGALPVRAKGYHITLQCIATDGMPVLLAFDFTTDCTFGNYPICEGRRILESRRRQGDFWVAAAAVEFTCLLQRSLLRSRLDSRIARRLSALFRQAPMESRAALNEFWPRHAQQLADIAASGDWGIVLANTAALRNSLRRRLASRNPGHFAASVLGTFSARFSRLISPPGLNVVLLGPDGAGKSSTIAALEKVMAPIFPRMEVRGFAPSLRQVLKKPSRSTNTPHALKPRSLPTSIVRAGYWALYGILCYCSLWLSKARSTLVFNDRHYVDILVDPVRYRYGGPRWLLKVIWHIMPAPDLVILLSGPAEVLQARKRELTVAETERQCRDYLALVTPMRNSHIVDATQPFDRVVRTVAAVVLDKTGRPPA